MTDCTDNPTRRPHVRSLAAVSISVAILWLALMALAAAARADGDPASDVLATQPLFVPQDAGVPIAQQGQLAAIVQTAARDGNPIRLALIASRTDLGSVTELWRQPQTYAKFLGQELSLIYRGPLVVVMPNGLGFSNGGPATGAALADLPIRTGGAGLAAAALTAIQRTAAAAGHPVAIPAPAATEAPSGPGRSTPIVALTVGAALIAIAWMASLRARPPRLPRRRTSAS